MTKKELEQRRKRERDEQKKKREEEKRRDKEEKEEKKRREEEKRKRERDDKDLRKKHKVQVMFSFSILSVCKCSETWTQKHRNSKKVLHIYNGPFYSCVLRCLAFE